MATESIPWIKKQTEGLENVDNKERNTKEENELLDVAIERFTIAETEKVDFLGEPLNNKWRRFDRIVRNQQWETSVPDDKSTPVLNFTWALIQSLIPRLTANNPTVILRPRMSAADQPLAEMLQTVLDHLWYTNKMQEEKIRESCLHMLKYGTAIIKQYWDVDKWDGLGEVAYTVIHPMNFYPDPRAYTLEDMDYCFIRVKKPLEYFLRRWPDKGKYVVRDEEWRKSEGLHGRDSGSRESTASLTEYWFRDENGDLCVMYYSGKIVLQVTGGMYDNAEVWEPVFAHNQFPFSRICDYNSDKEFWGIGEVEMIEILQRLINEYEAQIIDNTRLMGNAQWMINKSQSGLDESDAWIFDNNPGIALFSHNGGIERIAGVPIPPHIPAHLEKLIEWMEQILGVHDVVQGRRPVGVRAASAIIALQEAAGIRVAEKADNMAAAIRNTSEQAISMVLENYEEPRMVRLAGESVPTTLDVREALEQRIYDMAKMAGMEQTFEMEQAEMAPGDREAMMNELMQEIKFPEFDIEVNVGPTVPYSQALMYEQAKEFYQLGVIDRIAVLEVTNFPNKEEIITRMTQAEGQMAQQAGGERMGERTF
jgi:hypothetical protein